MSPFRRQLSLLLPEPERAVVDSVRQRIDPLQHAIIPAHVTLCREDEIGSWASIQSALSSLQGFDFTLSFAGPKSLPDGCLLLPVSGPTKSYDNLRSKILGDSCKSHDPHITILHPRNSAGRKDDLAELATVAFPTTVHFTEISVIEQVNGGVWNVVERYRVGF